MPTTLGNLGFGGTVTGGGAAAPTVCNDRVSLATALRTLTVTNAGPVVIELDNKSKDAYAFTGLTTAEQQFTIGAQNVTIRAKEGLFVRVRDLKLIVNVDTANNILIRDLNFRADGTQASVHDAIELSSANVADGGGPFNATILRANPSTARIHHCSFSGYYDIAVDSETRSDRPRLFITIDRCLFIDGRPGSGVVTGTGSEQRISTFVNRGAINFGSATGEAGVQLPGNARVTIAFNVFVDIWRRSPRIAANAFGHIYNNLLFRWGKGNKTETNWNGMVVGGGDSQPVTNGIALIQANRLIPGAPKTEPNDAIQINVQTKVDIGSGPSLPGLPSIPNRFDGPDGKELASGGAPTAPAGGFATINLSTFGGVATVQPKESVDWKAIYTNAVPSQMSAKGLDDLIAILNVTAPSPQRQMGT